MYQFSSIFLIFRTNYWIYFFRAPRERYQERDRNSMGRGEGEGDNDSINGRRSNSVGGGGGIGSKYSDRHQLFVGNLPLNITERELKEFFEREYL